MPKVTPSPSPQYPSVPKTAPESKLTPKPTPSLPRIVQCESDAGAQLSVVLNANGIGVTTAPSRYSKWLIDWKNQKFLNCWYPSTGVSPTFGFDQTCKNYAGTLFLPNGRAEQPTGAGRMLKRCKVVF